MSRANCLTDHAKRILHWTGLCQARLALIPPATTDEGVMALADSISCLAQAVEHLVLHDLPLWEKRDESGYPADQEEP